MRGEMDSLWPNLFQKLGLMTFKRCVYYVDIQMFRYFEFTLGVYELAGPIR